MKLQSLNCPNCGSVLTQEGNNLVCKSCGSAFGIDYDDSDVEYEKASTEVERLQQEHEHEKEMLEQEYRLKEEAEIRRQKRAKADARKSRISSSVMSLIKSLISLVVVGGIIFLFYSLIRNGTLKNKLEEIADNVTTTTTTINPYDFTKSDLESDSFFMENAIASVMSIVHEEKDNDTIRFWSDGEWDEWKLKGEPQIYDCYFLNGEKDNRVYFLVKSTYKCKGKDDTAIYNAYYLRKVTVDESGKIKCDYVVRGDSGDSVNWNWGGQFVKDQLYREVILGNTQFASEQLTLPEGVAPTETEEEKETEEQTEETTEQTEETTKKKKKKKK